ncbi:hypothetical protein DM860_017797 [Cuscuta australis]|uniref:Uncharacterized protein n=1 Tax=Cuscuta australis TaxID=267555 RepID=A0A328DRY0_9ASTE|nr:hypothetical protein DM860_017797 [Cuscuta australis]
MENGGLPHASCANIEVEQQATAQSKISTNCNVTKLKRQELAKMGDYLNKLLSRIERKSIILSAIVLISSGIVSQGIECEYHHNDIARLNPRDCWYWLVGNCLNLASLRGQVKYKRSLCL